MLGSLQKVKRGQTVRMTQVSPWAVHALELAEKHALERAAIATPVLTRKEQQAWLSSLPPLDVDRSGDIPLNRPELTHLVRS